MHNLAIALHKKGHVVSGSDDVLFDPALSRLQQFGLAPSEMGWNPEAIDDTIDRVILGMHAKEDNPELSRARELGLPIMSFPEFIAEECKDKKRIVLAGSHGKTTCTSMLMHALQFHGLEFDYMVGSSVDGFEDSVKLSDAPVVLLEGDEYLSSPIDLRPKFLWYEPHVLMITGIAWDHVNVFPTFEEYVLQFEKLIALQEEGVLIYFAGDALLDNIVGEQFMPSLHVRPYETPEHTISNGKTTIHHDDLRAPVAVIGQHNLQNLEGVRLVAEELGISAADFYTAMSGFTGAGRRMEAVLKNDSYVLYKDFAHSPSKVTASVKAVAEQYPEMRATAILELHTFSSLKKSFLPEYANSLDAAEEAVVFVNPETLKRKGNLQFTESEIREAFKRNDLKYIDDPEELKRYLEKLSKPKRAVIFMSSGNWGRVPVQEILST